MLKLFITTYLLVAVAWVPISYTYWPWEPHTEWNRLLGALVQAPQWPLALLAWLLVEKDN